ncbi:hypothetical protein OS493_028615 [Desmophyllum pertusum]|uniref:Uncharacterized protein n=1 Tax=Desmophyllum pertusum TaxID=174260 RepID=A0A9W9YWZ7_9CNID|nr:hypothetical protein OS493_028615 [Desmophyllum pertusum]
MSQTSSSIPPSPLLRKSNLNKVIVITMETFFPWSLEKREERLQGDGTYLRDC